MAGRLHTANTILPGEGEIVPEQETQKTPKDYQESFSLVF